MSFINHNAKRIHCKIVYYGPSLGGKTTNIQWVHAKASGKDKSELESLPTDLERTLFFDFVPFNLGEVQGYETRFHLYSVPGQVVYDASRKLILKGLDGIVFVADSQAERMEENMQALENLKSNLEMQGYDFENVPIVFQYNKRDLDNSLPIAELSQKLNHINAPEFEAEAKSGEGVFESLNSISETIIETLKSGKL